MGDQQMNTVSSGLLEFDNDLITLIVGEYERKFSVHLAQLKKSPWFESATKEEWLVDRTISLPEDNPDILHAYIHFLYAARIPNLNFYTLAHLYVYGEKIVDLHFKNAVIKAIIKKTNRANSCPGDKTVNIVYDGTLPGSQGRQLLLDLYSCSEAALFLDQEDEDYNVEFLKDLLRRHMTGSVQDTEKIARDEIVAVRYLEDEQ